MQGVYDAASKLVSVTSGKVTNADIVSFFSVSSSAAQQTTMGNLALALNASAAGLAKAWAQVTILAGAPTMNSSLNMTSITDNGVGDFTFTFTTPFTTANYVMVGSAQPTAGGSIPVVIIKDGVPPTANACRVTITLPVTANNADVPIFSVAFFGN